MSLTDNIYRYDAQEKVFETAQDHAYRMAEKEGRYSISGGTLDEEDFDD